jgi:4-hydroxy-3-methylbut-2-enyl diphosphate reductase IspH
MQERVDRVYKLPKIVKVADEVVDTLRHMGIIFVESVTQLSKTTTIIYNSQTREIKAHIETPQGSS